MEAFKTVLLTKVVSRSDPFQRTLDPLTKLVPFTVKVTELPPTWMTDGSRLAIVGTGLEGVMVKDIPLELPPPGAGVKTVTVTVPGWGSSAGVRVAVNFA